MTLVNSILSSPYQVQQYGVKEQKDLVPAQGLAEVDCFVNI